MTPPRVWLSFTKHDDELGLYENEHYLQTRINKGSAIHPIYQILLLSTIHDKSLNRHFTQ